jgi:hypothetical protein
MFYSALAFGILGITATAIGVLLGYYLRDLSAAREKSEAAAHLAWKKRQDQAQQRNPQIPAPDYDMENATYMGRPRG